MPDIDLKVYTRRIKDLEIAIYTQKNILKEHETIIDKNVPPLPQIAIKNSLKAPNKDDYYKDPPYELDLTIYKYLIICVALIFLIGGFCIFAEGNVYGSKIIGVSMMALSILVPLGIFKYSKMTSLEKDKWREECRKKYNEAYENYKIFKKEHEKTIIAQKNSIMEEYNKKLQQYYENASITLNKHKDNIALLEKTLEELYSQNIIFPKYRSLVAITMINEYLESGRCSELEGANGAYNLYEMELRQNIVIGQLSNIIGNLEQIRNNQYSLYEELTKSNKLVQDVVYELRELNSTAKLDAYFNYVTAVAETSPKIYHGITY